MLLCTGMSAFSKADLGEENRVSLNMWVKIWVTVLSQPICTHSRLAYLHLSLDSQFISRFFQYMIITLPRKRFSSTSKRFGLRLLIYTLNLLCCYWFNDTSYLSRICLSGLYPFYSSSVLNFSPWEYLTSNYTSQGVYLSVHFRCA